MPKPSPLNALRVYTRITTSTIHHHTPQRPNHLNHLKNLFTTMTKETTPPPPEQQTTREPPSLPTSPLAKRPKPNTTTEDQSKMTNSTPVTSISQPLPPLLIKKLNEGGRAPTRGSAFAAGYDVYAAKETVIPARGKALVDTGIAIAVPEGTCMFLTLTLSISILFHEL